MILKKYNKQMYDIQDRIKSLKKNKPNSGEIYILTERLKTMIAFRNLYFIEKNNKDSQMLIRVLKICSLMGIDLTVLCMTDDMIDFISSNKDKLKRTSDIDLIKISDLVMNYQWDNSKSPECLEDLR